MRSLKLAGCSLAIVLLFSSLAFGGGTGENMLLIVNPNDENSLRIANAYQQLRGIPDCNIIFITPPAYSGQYTVQSISTLSQTQFMNSYVTPIANAIASRGLTNQIDYIGTLGQAWRYANLSTGEDNCTSLNYGLTLLTPLSNGQIQSINDGYNIMSALYQDYTTIPVNSASEAAIHHSQTYSVGLYSLPSYSTYYTASVQYYMSGMVGWTGLQGNTADQIISNLQRTAAADGTNPGGTVYLEGSTNASGQIRAYTRTFELDYTKSQLQARGVPVVEEIDPKNPQWAYASNVRGLVVGSPNNNLSHITFAPGAWADNLTSYGARWDDFSQSKASIFIAAGCAGSSGAVVEPYAESNRFPNSSIQTFYSDGNTLGEAFAKSVQTPDILQFLGDMLAQPYADVPSVSITSGPAQGATVSGSISLGVKGSLTSPRIATGISNLQLYIDGKLSGSPVTGASGTFNINTTGLSDGQHQFTIVAANNSQAASDGTVTQSIVVNNHGESVAINGVTGGNLNVTATQVAPISVTAIQGTGTVSQIELTNLGRVLGTVSAASGTVNINASSLAYGANQVTPVALYTDGSQVAGAPITITRAPTYLPGSAVTPLAQQTPGVYAEYFLGQGRSTIAASTFNGTPDATAIHSTLNIYSGTSSGIYPNTHLSSEGPVSAMPTINGSPININQLAVRLTANFNVPSTNTGEYQFFFFSTNDSAQLSIDSQYVLGFDSTNAGTNNGYGYTTTDEGGQIYLGAGQHDLTLLASNLTAGVASAYFDISLFYRGPDGVTHPCDGSFLYVPEPTTCMLLLVGFAALTRRAKQRRVGCE